MSKKNLGEAIQFLNVNKKHGRDWVYMHIKMGPFVPDTILRDVQAAAKPKFAGEDHAIYIFDPHNELLILTNARRRGAFAEIEKHVIDTFPDSEAKFTYGDLGEPNLEQIGKIISKLIGDTDRMHKMAFKRLMRQANSIMVLDDDPITLRTAEKILKNFGFVNTVETPQQFFETYEDYAPNIVFVDIHLKGYKGPPIIKVAREKFDPYIHPVMISSDTAKETILSVKESGAAGFIVKPFNRDTLFQHLLNAPTFVSKTGG